MQCVCGSSTCSSRDLTAAFGVILFTKFAIQLLCFNEEEVTAMQQRLALKRRESCFDFDFVLDLMKRAARKTPRNEVEDGETVANHPRQISRHISFFGLRYFLIRSVYNFYFFYFLFF
jgi:hypothetical protein